MAQPDLFDQTALSIDRQKKHLIPMDFRNEVLFYIPISEIHGLSLRFSAAKRNSFLGTPVNQMQVR